MLGDWVSYHIYYHEDLDRLVQGLIVPVVYMLIERDAIDRFFFVRYGLGGPHVRLRLRPVKSRATVESLARAAIESFLQACPSCRSINESTLRASAARIIAEDSHEELKAIPGDNTYLIEEFRPEVERYGGLDLLPFSLDLFATSSMWVLDLVRRGSIASTTRRLKHGLQLILWQALHFSRDPEELRALVRYAYNTWGAEMPGVVKKAEQVFERQRDSLVAMVEHQCQRAKMRSFADLSTLDLPSLHGGAAQLLAAKLDSQKVRDKVRYMIKGSHIHMTSTRLGLMNPEEVYLCRMLSMASDFASGEIARALTEIARFDARVTIAQLANCGIRNFTEGAQE